jgi:hypothetical protein
MIRLCSVDYYQGGFTPYNAPILFASLDDLKAAIVAQFDYYFSMENLVKDQYLRSLMDSDFAVSLQNMLQFNRVSRMTPDLKLIADALRGSQVVEVLNGDKVRRRHEPEKFPVLPPPASTRANFSYAPAYYAPPPYAAATKIRFDLNAPEYVPSTTSSQEPATPSVSVVQNASAATVEPESPIQPSTSVDPNLDDNEEDWKEVKANQQAKAAATVQAKPGVGSGTPSKSPATNPVAAKVSLFFFHFFYFCRLILVE